MAQTPNLLLELLANSPGNQINANTSFSILDQLVMPRVLDKDLSTPPGSPANGAMYIVAASATGAWAGKEKNLAWWLTSVGAWTFLAPALGLAVRVVDELDSNNVPQQYVYDGTAWTIPAGGSGGTGGWDAKLSPAISAGALTIDLTDPAGFVVTLNQNVTSLTFANAPSDKAVVFTIKWVQDGTGGRTVTWPGSVQGSPSQPSGTAGEVTIQSFYTDDGGTTVYQAP